MNEYLWLVILGGCCSFLASVGIGANDAANAFATSVGAKTIKLFKLIVVGIYLNIDDRDIADGKCKQNWN